MVVLQSVLIVISCLTVSCSHLDQILHSAEGAESCSKNSSFGCIVNTTCSQIGVARNDSKECRLLLLPSPQEVVHDKEVAEDQKPTLAQIWGFGGISVFIISLSGIFGAVLWPVLNSPLYPHLMRVLIGLAVGSLTSTSVFQLIPEGFDLLENDPSHTYLKSAMFTWFSFWLLFSVEALSKILFGGRRKKKKVHSSVNGHTCAPLPLKEVEGLNNLLTTATTPIQQKRASIADTGQKIATMAWIIILGDGLHNFIDGMSIGAGYTQSIATGVTISIAIACEEFPHELGDFAILIQSGMPFKKAMLFNFLSACTAFLGLALGIILGELEGAKHIFAFAGGLFLYVSLTHLIPELQDMLKESLAKSRGQALLSFFLQNIGILTGSVLLYLITRYNEYITFL
uniref:Zinc transporter ZIP8 n=1 Tax=Clastoptera arizonana TaxID=38151 RepID=A0A1B6C7C2_9HEMI